MDKFTQLANGYLNEIDKVAIKEDNEIMVKMKSGQSFGDFLRSLVGKSRKNILDSASFARLYDMNMSAYGGSRFNNEENPHGLMSKFMTKFSDYVNQGITELRSGAAETDEFKNKYDYQGYLEREKERRDLIRQSMTEKDPEKKAELRQKKNAFRNNSEYAEARRALYKKEDAAVDQYHNRPIEQGEIVNDGSDEFKELENLYNKIISIKGKEGSRVSDEEILTKDQQKALSIAQKLSTQAAKSGVIGFRTDPQKAINKAYGRVMKGIADKINKIKI
jgi:hypothetical protein